MTPERRESQDQLRNSQFYDIRNNSVKFYSSIKLEREVIVIGKGKEGFWFQYYNRLHTYKGHQASRIRFQKDLLRRGINNVNMLTK